MSDWQVATVVGTDEEAQLIAGFLASRGVPAQVESLLFHQDPVNFGAIGEVRVLVDAAELDEAKALIAEGLPVAEDLLVDDGGGDTEA